MNLKEKIAALEADNNNRAEEVRKLLEQREQILATVHKLKEEHDFYRGQITALKELEGESTETSVQAPNPLTTPAGTVSNETA